MRNNVYFILFSMFLNTMSFAQTIECEGVMNDAKDDLQVQFIKGNTVQVYNVQQKTFFEIDCYTTEGKKYLKCTPRELYLNIEARVYTDSKIDLIYFDRDSNAMYSLASLTCDEDFIRRSKERGDWYF